MLFILVLPLIMGEKIKILYAKDTSLALSIIQLDNGDKKVRLIDKNNPPTQEVFSVFDVTDGITQLDTTVGVICGKSTDPGVIVCTDKGDITLVEFVKRDELVNIKFNNNKCLKKKGFDKKTKGYYLNLSNCDGNPDQDFNYTKNIF